MQTRRWVNQSQPQTLVIATFLLYFNAILAFAFRQSTQIGAGLLGPNGNPSTADSIDTVGLLFVIVGGIAAGYLISNEKKMGWYLAIGVAALPLVATALLVVRFDNVSVDFVGLLFQVALLALILHEQSRSYVRLWFK